MNPPRQFVSKNTARWKNLPFPAFLRLSGIQNKCYFGKIILYNDIKLINGWKVPCNTYTGGLRLHTEFLENLSLQSWSTVPSGSFLRRLGRGACVCIFLSLLASGTLSVPFRNSLFCLGWTRWYLSCGATQAYLLLNFQSLFFKYFIYLFLERGEERKKERERNIDVWNTDQLPLSCPQLGSWPATQAWALTGNWTSNLSLPRAVLNPLSYTSQGSTSHPFFPL